LIIESNLYHFYFEYKLQDGKATPHQSSDDRNGAGPTWCAWNPSPRGLSSAINQKYRNA